MMSKAGDDGACVSELDKWLKRFGAWNTKRTKATCSIFSIPNKLLCNQFVEVKSAVTVPETVSSTPHFGSTDEKGLTCRACNVTFPDHFEQQQHFKSDLHRINLVRNLAGKEPVKELKNDHLEPGSSNSEGGRGVHFAENEGNSSGSDEEEDLIYTAADFFDEGQSDDERDVNAAERRIEYITDEGVARKYISKQDGPQYLFSPRTDISWDISVSVGVLHDTTNVDSYSVEPWSLLSRAVHRIQDKRGSMWCVLILRSGKFAGAIFDGHTVLTHKVLRRYTVRAKAGGSQSSHDGQGKNAKSVGAMLRRYGEQALTEDVRALLKDWSAHLQSCSAVFLSCPKTMRSVIFEEGLKDKETPLKRTDPRVRLVPFMVKRPTFEEVKLIHTRLSTISFHPRGSLDAPLIEDAHESSSSNNTDDVAVRRTAVEIPPAPLLPSCRQSKRLFLAASTGDLDQLKLLLEDINRDDIVNLHPDQKEELDVLPSSCPSEALISQADADARAEVDIENDTWDLKDVLNMPETLEGMSTCLHMASERGLASVVSLLLAAGADPTRLDVRGRPPYFLAKTKEVRDAFRRARANAEELFAWDAAGVPAALTEEMEQAQREKEKEKKKRSKANKKAKDEKDAFTAAQAALDKVEQKAEAVRDLANRAAMAGVCAQCSRSLHGAKALDVFDRRCCSSTCVLLLRRELAARAAENRTATKA